MNPDEIEINDDSIGFGPNPIAFDNMVAWAYERKNP